MQFLCHEHDISLRVVGCVATYALLTDAEDAHNNLTMSLLAGGWGGVYILGWWVGGCILGWRVVVVCW